MWVPPEVKDPILLHHPTRKSMGYFGAVRLRDGKFTYRMEMDKFNSETFFMFLKQLRSISCHAGRRVFLIADNARYHHGLLHKQWRQSCSDRFSIEFLPPYSPELNPIERVWKLTRHLAIHNRYFPSLEDIVKAVEKVFLKWKYGNDALRRLCAFK